MSDSDNTTNKDTIPMTTNAINKSMEEFTSPSAVNTTNEGFLNSNGVIAKVVFLIMVAIVFIVLFVISIRLIGYFLSPNPNPIIIDGQITGNRSKTISQNPTNSLAQILRSNNEASGIEFTWTVWLYYAGSIGETKYSPVFVKGDCSAPSASEFCSINNGPGVYFGKNDGKGSNILYILMDSVNTAAVPTKTIDTIDINALPANIIVVPNIPTNNYFHLAIRCRNSYIDVYINGTVVKSQNLMNVPKQNYYDLVVCPTTGFSGYLSQLQYFSKALSVVEINSIVQKGPNLKDANQLNLGTSMPSNISTSWYNSFLK
jgi:hypothetical protein